MRKQTPTKKFEELRSIIGEIRDRTKSDGAKRWLNISLQEITQSEDHYEKGKREMGQDVIQRAEEHFRNAFCNQTNPGTVFLPASLEPQSIAKVVFQHKCLLELGRHDIVPRSFVRFAKRGLGQARTA